MHSSLKPHRLVKLLNDLPPRIAIPDVPASLSLVLPEPARTYPTPESFEVIDKKTFNPSPSAHSFNALMKLPCMNSHSLSSLSSDVPVSSEREVPEYHTNDLIRSAPLSRTDDSEQRMESKEAHPFPSFSSLPLPVSHLTAKQHIDFLRISAKPVSKRTRSDTKLFNELSAIVEREQSEYKQHFIDEAQQNCDCYSYVRKDVEDLFIRYVKERCDRMTKNIPLSYSWQATTEISNHCESPVFLLHSGRVFESGSCVEWKPVDSSNRLLIDGLDSVMTEKHTHSCSLVDDPVVSSWTSKHIVDIVITASALSALVEVYTTVDSSFCDDQLGWIRLVPVTIEKRRRHRVVFIGSALPREYATNRDATEWVLSQRIDAIVNGSSDVEHSKQFSFTAPDLAIEHEEAHRAVLYNMWDFGELNVLTRGHAHYITPQLEKESSATEVFTGVKVKTHVCTSEGRKEAFTEQEALMWYFKLLLLPRAKTMLTVAHANMLSGEIVGLENIPFSQILSLAPVKVEEASATIHNVFAALKKLTEGRYIIALQAGLKRCDVYAEESSSDTTSGFWNLNLKDVVARCSAVHPAEPKKQVSVIPRWNGPADRIPNTFQPQQQQNEQSRPTHLSKVCYKFVLEGKCTDKSCPYDHYNVTEEERAQIQKIVAAKTHAAKGKKASKPQAQGKPKKKRRRKGK